jgi:polyisoprenoid-binding protein YceI
MFAAVRILSLAAVLMALGTAARAADTFSVDPVHSSISFITSHAGISYIHGRFNEYSGKFVIDKDDPAKSSFFLSIKVESVDTGNVKRDEHLRAPDYFNAKQFPNLTFQSTSVKKVDGGYEVAGDLTVHGVTKPVTLSLKGGDKMVEFPKGVQRIGIQTTPAINRSEYDMKAGLPSLGDEVLINIAIEAVKE